MPTYLGTLILGDATTTSTTSGHVAPPQVPTKPLNETDTRIQPDTTHLKGRPLSSPHLLVLSNITSTLTRPNVLDLKLGSRLWDDSAPPAKRARLDAVAQNSTSSSLGFRVAGMRIWEGTSAGAENGVEKHSSDSSNGSRDTTNSSNTNGHPDTETKSHAQSHLDPQTNVRFYNKLYGRSLTSSNVSTAIRRFLHVPEAGISLDTGATLAAAFLDEVRELRSVLEREEIRIVSGSILIAYEGDGGAFERRVRELQEHTDEGNAVMDGETDGDGEMDDEDDEEPPVLYRVKLIDFAHARFTPGEGPDENVLLGVRNIERILGEVYEELVAEQTAVGKH
jgi:inositol-polyphosphate multikinase